MMALVGWVKSHASISPACDALKTALSELDKEVEKLGALHTQEETLFADEEKVWTRVDQIQDAVLAKTDAVSLARDRMITLLAEKEVDHQTRLELVQKLVDAVARFENLDYKDFEKDREGLLCSLRTLEDAINRAKGIHTSYDELIKQLR